MAWISFDAGSEISLDSDSDNLEDQENLPAFRSMYNTVLNHNYPSGKWNYVQTSNIFYSINDGNPERLRNVPRGTHTEVILINSLQGRELSKKDSTNVIVYSNNSPCSKCAEALQEFLNENENFSLTVYVAHLYNIIRQSCKNNQEEYITECRVTECQSERNAEALCKLMEHGRCKIKAFGKETWRYLINILNLQDEMLNFDKIYKEKQAGDERSRMEEDQLVNQDLGHIFCNYVLEQIFFMGLDDDESSSKESSKISHLVYRVNKNQAEKMHYTTQIGEDFMQKLEKTYDGKTMIVNLYISRSPSPMDAKWLLRFLKEKRLAEVTIYVANLYGIRRNSCKTEPHYEDVSQETSTKNSDGLRDLMDHKRCELKAFDEGTWEDLMYTLNIEDENFSQNYRKKYDGCHRSRKREDERIKEDLECIYKEEK